MTDTASGTNMTGDRRPEIARHTHTPPPWIAIPYISPKGKSFIKQLDGEVIVSGQGLSDADAEFVVLTINSHDDMLAALKAVRPLVMREIAKGKGLFADADLAQIDAAIAKAEGRGSPVANPPSNEEGMVP